MKVHFIPRTVNQMTMVSFLCLIFFQNVIPKLEIELLQIEMMHTTLKNANNGYTKLYSNDKAFTLSLDKFL